MYSCTYLKIQNIGTAAAAKQINTKARQKIKFIQLFVYMYYIYGHMRRRTDCAIIKLIIICQFVATLKLALLRNF